MCHCLVNLRQAGSTKHAETRACGAFCLRPLSVLCGTATQASPGARRAPRLVVEATRHGNRERGSEGFQVVAPSRHTPAKKPEVPSTGSAQTRAGNAAQSTRSLCLAVQQAAGEELQASHLEISKCKVWGGAQRSKPSQPPGRTRLGHIDSRRQGAQHPGHRRKGHRRKGSRAAPQCGAYPGGRVGEEAACELRAVARSKHPCAGNGHSG
jgi:hypothetical protein